MSFCKVRVGDAEFRRLELPQPLTYEALRALLVRSAPLWNVADPAVREGRFAISYKDDQGDAIAVTW